MTYTNLIMYLATIPSYGLDDEENEGGNETEIDASTDKGREELKNFIKGKFG